MPVLWGVPEDVERHLNGILFQKQKEIMGIVSPGSIFLINVTCNDASPSQRMRSSRGFRCNFFEPLKSDIFSAIRSLVTANDNWLIGF